MANAQVVDELIVKLRLDSRDYKRSDKEVDRLVSRTERKARQTDARRRRREREEERRRVIATRSVKRFTLAMRSLALSFGAVLGVAGGATGIIGAVGALAGLETNLRRAAVATSLSNRQLQAWGSTARRLGSDSDAGARAIAELAREQQQFNLTGNAPTLQALASIGVQVGQNVPLENMLGAAQARYRAAEPAQRERIEAMLAAQGVSNDLIVMIKSETDARTAYLRSFAEASEENKRAMNAVGDTVAALAGAATALANAIAGTLQPAIETVAEYAHAGANRLREFGQRVIDAGGGVQGFQRVLDAESPQVSSTLRAITASFRTLGEVVDVVAYGWSEIWRMLRSAFSWLDRATGAQLSRDRPLSFAGGLIRDAVRWAWGNTVTEARRYGPAPIGQLTAERGGARAPAARTILTERDLMQLLVEQYGLSIPEAAAVTANASAESRLNPAAYNTAGGGTGARGLMQWRGARSAAFQARYGRMPNEATIEQQLDFMFSDPYELRRLRESLQPGGSASQLGERYSRIFEAHANVAEDARRGRAAAALARDYQPASDTAAASSTTVSINGPVYVQANNPEELTDSIQRMSNVQNYHSGVR